MAALVRRESPRFMSGSFPMESMRAGEAGIRLTHPGNHFRPKQSLPSPYGDRIGSRQPCLLLPGVSNQLEGLVRNRGETVQRGPDDH
jgi:hypothetical protein